MTDLFAGVLPFVYTAEERSFRRAAERLGVSTAAVSKSVARLEADLGVRLLDRTSRRVELTAEGEKLLTHGKDAIAQLLAGREAVSQSQRAPRGTVSNSLPFVLGRLLVPRLARLAARHPGLSFRVSLSDRFSRLVDDRVDVAVRIGDLEDSSLVARRLRTTRWITLAAPSFLARHGTPRHPVELEAFNTLRFASTRGRTPPWTFRDPTGVDTFSVETRGNLEIDHGEMLLDLAAAGMGICQVLDFMPHDYVRRGDLIEVLAPFAADGPPIHALSLAGRSAPRVRAVVDFLQEELATPRDGADTRGSRSR